MLQPADFRSDFPVLNQRVHADQPLVYLDNAASTQMPRQVVAAMVECRESYYANVHRGIHSLSERSTDAYEEARRKVATWIGATPTEVVFTSGTTAAINLVARSWGEEQLTANDEILLSEMEHHSNLVPWQQVAARTGCRLRFIPLTEDGRLQLDAVESLLTERTRLVAVTAVSNVLGTINPISELARRAHAVAALLLVDAAQHVPHSLTDVAAWDADFVAFSGHKMCGPTGIGVLYGKESLLDSMPPFLGGGSMIQRVTLDGFTPAELPAKFEAGTPPILGAIGLGAAVDYLQAIGLPAIEEHERRLVSAAHDLLRDFGGVRILGPTPDAKGGIVSFLVDGVHPHDTAEVLDQYGVAVRAGHHCAMPLHQRLGVPASCRASFYLYNTAQELDRFGAGLQAVRRLFQR